MPQRGTHAPPAVAFELVADRRDRFDDRSVVVGAGAGLVVGRASDPHQPASFGDGDARGPTIADVGALFGRGAFFRAPFRNSSSSACLPTSRSSAAIRASYCSTRSAAAASSSNAPVSISLNPNPDQIARQVVALRKAVKRLASQKLLCDLTFELKAVRAMLGHGLSSFESPAYRSIVKPAPVRPEGPTPPRGAFCALFGPTLSPRQRSRTFFAFPRDQNDGC